MSNVINLDDYRSEATDQTVQIALEVRKMLSGVAANNPNLTDAELNELKIPIFKETVLAILSGKVTNLNIDDTNAMTNLITIIAENIFNYTFNKHDSEDIEGILERLNRYSPSSET